MSVETQASPGAPDPLELGLFSDAAKGDASALVILAHLARNPATYDPPVPEAEASAAAEAFARLAAMHGEASAKLLLADILCQRSAAVSNRVHASRLLNEATHWLREAMKQGHPDAASRLACLLAILSDEGDEAAAIELNRLMDQLGPQQAAEVRGQVSSNFASAQAK